MHTQRAHTAYLNRRGAHHILIVKGNQPNVHRQLRSVPWKHVPAADTTSNKGHGRVETRIVKPPEGTHPTTQPWSSTGPTGDANANPHRLRRPGSATWASSKDSASCVGNPLLYVDPTPDSLTQWETWYRGIRKTLAHQAITESGSCRTTGRLLHAHCARRHPDGETQDPD